VSTWDPRRPDVTIIDKEEKGAVNALSAPGEGENAEARQHKPRRKIQHPIYF